MTIRAAVFDLGGVLEIVDDDRWQEEWAARWEAHAGRPAGALIAGADPDLRSALEDGTVTEDRMRPWFRSALGLSPTDADLMLEDLWTHYCGTLDEAMRDFVLELGRVMTTAALSNSTDGARREDEARHGLGSLFDVLVYSHEVGLAKPDPRIFRLLEERLGVGAHEVVFVDDRREHVDAATALGWNAVLHAHTPTTVAEVRAVIDGAG